MSKPAPVRSPRTQKARGTRSGRTSTREVYRAPAPQPAKTHTETLQRQRRDLPPVLKDRSGLANEYSCRLAPGQIARVRLSRRSRTQFWIDWVHVPPAHRDRGVGRHLFAAVLADADALGVRLGLEARACAGLSQERLEAWYGSMGFERTPLRGDFGPIMLRSAQRRVLSVRRAA
ncbi:MAG: N-acetyltransferase [Planctomycetota bacterium]|nr:MAG: N-acetyltransferase [Planctomycetota bacterium]